MADCPTAVVNRPGRMSGEKTPVVIGSPVMAAPMPGPATTELVRPVLPLNSPAPEKSGVGGVGGVSGVTGGLVGSIGVGGLVGSIGAGVVGHGAPRRGGHGQTRNGKPSAATVAADAATAKIDADIHARCFITPP